MALCKIKSVPDICSDYLYCQVNNCLCGCMHLKTSKTSSADSHLHLEVLMKFHSINFHNISTIIPIHDHQFLWSSILPNRMSFETSSNLWNYRNTSFTSQEPITVQYIQIVKHFMHHDKIKAIGECGLDNTKKHSYLIQNSVSSII